MSVCMEDVRLRAESPTDAPLLTQEHRHMTAMISAATEKLESCMEVHSGPQEQCSKDAQREECQNFLYRTQLNDIFGNCGSEEMPGQGGTRSVSVA